MKFAVRTLLALALFTPALSLATSADFGNQGGALTGSNAGLTLAGSTLISFQLGGGSIATGNLGTISFSTSALNSGSLAMGGTFAPGGAFAITGNGSAGLPNGAVFTGTFSGPVVWSLITLANGTHNYTLTATLSGTWFTGQSVQGVTTQLTVNTGKGFFNGNTLISSGNTSLTGIGVKSVVPEPGTLGMLGTGLLGIAGVVRRKLRLG